MKPTKPSTHKGHTGLLSVIMDPMGKTTRVDTFDHKDLTKALRLTLESLPASGHAHALVHTDRLKLGNPALAEAALLRPAPLPYRTKVPKRLRVAKVAKGRKRMGR